MEQVTTFHCRRQTLHVVTLVAEVAEQHVLFIFRRMTHLVCLDNVRTNIKKYSNRIPIYHTSIQSPAQSDAKGNPAPSKSIESFFEKGAGGGYSGKDIWVEMEEACVANSAQRIALCIQHRRQMLSSSH